MKADWIAADFFAVLVRSSSPIRGVWSFTFKRFTGCKSSRREKGPSMTLIWLWQKPLLWSNNLFWKNITGILENGNLNFSGIIIDILRIRYIDFGISVTNHFTILDLKLLQLQCWNNILQSNTVNILWLYVEHQRHCFSSFNYNIVKVAIVKCFAASIP